jgi:hypothetical protein
MSLVTLAYLKMVFEVRKLYEPFREEVANLQDVTDRVILREGRYVNVCHIRAGCGVTIFRVTQ